MTLLPTTTVRHLAQGAAKHATNRGEMMPCCRCTVARRKPELVPEQVKCCRLLVSERQQQSVISPYSLQVWLLLERHYLVRWLQSIDVVSQQEVCSMVLGGNVQQGLILQGSKAQAITHDAACFQACQYDGCRLEGLASRKIRPLWCALHLGHSISILHCVAAKRQIADAALWTAL